MPLRSFPLVMMFLFLRSQLDPALATNMMTELELMIWEMLAQEIAKSPHIYKVSYKKGDGYRVMRAPPVVLRICQNSRQIGLKYFTRVEADYEHETLRLPFDFKTIYFNKDGKDRLLTGSVAFGLAGHPPPIECAPAPATL